LLQLITGTLTPTTGSIQTKGRIAALLELGSGLTQSLRAGKIFISMVLSLDYRAQK
jgi:ABC-type polysaccharide/polyol phosphate transport system ATPase subunit